MLQDLGIIYPTENSTYKKRYGLYKCYCGNEFKAIIRNVKNGNTNSCGCYKIKRATKHGLYHHPVYDVWRAMIQRCNNKNHKRFVDYGGRGIIVCERWLEFENFYEDMKNKYQEGLTLDRINVNGNYEKSNCRWTTQTVQNRNKRVLMSTNTSGYRGVSFCKQNNKWHSKIKVNSKTIHIGYFNTVLEAAMAYDNYVITNNLEHTLNFKRS